jgi:hypothetical protein
MKLPDFSKHVGLNQLRQQMGTELIPWESGGNWDPIDIDGLLVTTGIDIPPEEIEYAPDGTLEYNGRKVVVYIRDQYMFDSYESVNPAEWVDPEQLCRFHVSDCPTLKTMRSQNRYDRYVVATRTDGQFIVNFLVEGRIHDRGERVERRLYVCKNCLNKLDYKNYRNRRTQRDEIRDSFDLNEFFEMYNSRIAIEPTGTDITAPVNQYPPNWDRISRNYRETMRWRCEGCDIDLTDRREFLEVHHINGLRNNNREENLCALCISCHAEQFQHQHIRSNSRYQAFLQWRNQQQSNREDFSNRLIL